MFARRPSRLASVPAPPADALQRRPNGTPGGYAALARSIARRAGNRALGAWIARQVTPGGTGGGGGRRTIVIDGNILDEIHRGNEAVARRLRDLAPTNDVWIAHQAYQEKVVNRAIPRMATADRLIVEELGIRVAPAPPAPIVTQVATRNQLPNGKTVMSQADVHVAASAVHLNGEVWSVDGVFADNTNSVRNTVGVQVANESQTIRGMPHPKPQQDYRRGLKLVTGDDFVITLNGVVTSRTRPGGGGGGGGTSGGGGGGGTTTTTTGGGGTTTTAKGGGGTTTTTTKGGGGTTTTTTKGGGSGTTTTTAKGGGGTTTTVTKGGGGGAGTTTTTTGGGGGSGTTTTSKGGGSGTTTTPPTKPPPTGPPPVDFAEKARRATRAKFLAGEAIQALNRLFNLIIDTQNQYAIEAAYAASVADWETTMQRDPTYGLLIPLKFASTQPGVSGRFLGLGAAVPGRNEAEVIGLGEVTRTGAAHRSPLVRGGKIGLLQPRRT